ncbi:MAG: DNA replication/repair protein RecF [Nitriliruptoraceae bacterium]
MWIESIALTEFRSYERQQLQLQAGITIFVGPNAQGKTNLLEAIHRAARGTSHRVAGDQPLLRQGAQEAAIHLVCVTDERRRRTIDVAFGNVARTRTRVDGQQLRRNSDLNGVLPLVLFAPEDLAIVRGDPEQRRRFLDDALSQRRPAYAAARSEYERVLRQRNQLLRQMQALSPSAQQAASATMAAWTEQLVQFGTQLVAARLTALQVLAEPIARHYQFLSGRPERIGVSYVSTISEESNADATAMPLSDRSIDPATITEQYRAAIARRAVDEIRRGTTLVGPHRDDVELRIGDLAARGYSSHGEAWSLALALKLATVDLLTEVGDRPVVLLDDVFAELDEHRRQQLAHMCQDYDQVLVTAAVAADVPLDGHYVTVVRDTGMTILALREESGES